jgi:FkbM family methyltransferase
MHSNIDERFAYLSKIGFEPKVILDIGANVGKWSRAAHMTWPNARFIMVEANEDCRTSLLNSKLGETYIALLGRENRDNVDYFASTKKYTTGNSIYIEQSSYFDECEKRKLPMKKLDQLAKDNDWGHIDLIKMDTQGSELEIISGGENVIQQAEFVLLETQILTFNLGAPKTIDVINMMDKLKFRIFDITEIHRLPSGEMLGFDILFARNDSRFIKTGKLF